MSGEKDPTPGTGGQKPKKKRNYSAKSKNFPIRFSHDEIRDFKKQAETLGVTPTAYLRSRIYGTKVNVISIDATYSKMLFELNKIGVNLNQIAHKINQNQVSNTQFEGELYKISDDIKVILGGIKDKI